MIYVLFKVINENGTQNSTVHTVAIICPEGPEKNFVIFGSKFKKFFTARKIVFTVRKIIFTDF